MFLSRSFIKIEYCGQPPWPNGSVLGLRSPGLKFRILCLEDCVISLISPSSGCSPGPFQPTCTQRWHKTPFILFLQSVTHCKTPSCDPQIYWLGDNYFGLKLSEVNYLTQCHGHENSKFYPTKTISLHFIFYIKIRMYLLRIRAFTFSSRLGHVGTEAMASSHRGTEHWYLMLCVRTFSHNLCIVHDGIW